MSTASVFPTRRFLLVLIMMFSPFLTPVFVVSSGLSDAKLSVLPLVGGVALASLILSLAAACFLGPAENSADVSRLAKILLANGFFIAFEMAIFAVLAYGRNSSPRACADAVCELYPVGLLALAAMHLCYVALGCLIKIREKV